MNDIIYEFGKNSGLDLLTQYLDDDQWNNIEPRLEKFAELIIKECSKIADERQFKHRSNYPISITIEERFGVK